MVPANNDLFISESFPVSLWNRHDNEGNEKGFCLFHDGIALALVNWQWLLIDAQFRGLMAQMSLSPLRLGLIEIWKGQRLQRMWRELLTTLLWFYVFGFMSYFYYYYIAYLKGMYDRKLQIVSNGEAVRVVSFLVRRNFPKRILYCCMRNSCMFEFNMLFAKILSLFFFIQKNITFSFRTESNSLLFPNLPIN